MQCQQRCKSLEEPTVVVCPVIVKAIFMKISENRSEQSSFLNVICGLYLMFYFIGYFKLSFMNLVTSEVERSFVV